MKKIDFRPPYKHVVGGYARFVKIDKLLSWKKCRKLLSDDNYTFSRNYGLLILVGTRALPAFCLNKPYKPIHIKILAAVAHLQTLFPYASRDQVFELVGGDRKFFGRSFLDVMAAGYIMDKWRGKFMLTVVGHQINMEFADYCTAYAKKLLLQ